MLTILNAFSGNEPKSGTEIDLSKKHEQRFKDEIEQLIDENWENYNNENEEAEELFDRNLKSKSNKQLLKVNNPTLQCKITQ